MQLVPSSDQPRQVRQRCVFYLSGFDPKGAAHYHAMYRTEAALQAQVSGMPMEVGVRQKTASGNSFWKVSANPPEGPVKTHYVFFRWDDIVREHWPRSRIRLITDLLCTTWLNLRTGTLWRMFRLSWPPAVALFAPFLLLCAVLLGTPLLVAIVVWQIPPIDGWVPTIVAITTLTALWLAIALALEKKYGMAWLLRSYAFTASQAGGRASQIDARLEQHAESLLHRINNYADDEVLIVGHSSGSMMAASVLAKALSRDPQLGARGPVVSLLTLGQCMPMLGCLPQARAFRSDLQRLANAEAIDWLDFSAPPDGCCFALTDPLAACGVTNEKERQDRPKLLSPRFAEMFELPQYLAIKRDKLRMHFQYLMAGSKATSYDFFAITAGAKTLADRFKNEASVRRYAGLQIVKIKNSAPRHIAGGPF